MILIAHRGNVNGSDPLFENHPAAIDLAIEQGYEVEVDLWMKSGKLYLGHDKPEIQTDEDYLYKRRYDLWIHCKNYLSLEYCIDNELHCFFHDTDDYTITSQGYVWAYPGKPLSSKKCIMVKPELFDFPSINGYAGVCSDYIERIREDVKAN